MFSSLDRNNHNCEPPNRVHQAQSEAQIHTHTHTDSKRMSKHSTRLEYPIAFKAFFYRNIFSNTHDTILVQAITINNQRFVHNSHWASPLYARRDDASELELCQVKIFVYRICTCISVNFIVYVFSYIEKVSYIFVYFCIFAYNFKIYRKTYLIKREYNQILKSRLNCKFCSS